MLTLFDLRLDGWDATKACNNNDNNKVAYDFVHQIPGRYQNFTFDNSNQPYYKHMLSFDKDENYDLNSPAKNIIIFRQQSTDYWCIYRYANSVDEDLSCSSASLSTSSGLLAFSTSTTATHPAYVGSGEWRFPVTCDIADPVEDVVIRGTPAGDTLTPTASPTVGSHSCVVAGGHYNYNTTSFGEGNQSITTSDAFNVSCKDGYVFNDLYGTTTTLTFRCELGLGSATLARWYSVEEGIENHKCEQRRCKWAGSEADYPNIASNLRPNREPGVPLKTDTTGGSYTQINVNKWCKLDMYWLDPTVKTIHFRCPADVNTDGYFVVNKGQNDEKTLVLDPDLPHDEFQCGVPQCNLSASFSDVNFLSSRHLLNADDIAATAAEDWQFPFGDVRYLACRPGYWNGASASRLAVTCDGTTGNGPTTVSWVDGIHTCVPENDCTITPSMWQEFHGFVDVDEFNMNETSTDVGAVISPYQCPDGFIFANPSQNTCWCNKDYDGTSSPDPSCGKCEWNHCTLRGFKDGDHSSIVWSVSDTAPVANEDPEGWFDHQECDESASFNSPDGVDGDVYKVNHGVQCKANCTGGDDQWLRAELHDTTSGLTGGIESQVSNYVECKSKCNKAPDCRIAEYNSSDSKCRLFTSAASIGNWAYEVNVHTYIITQDPVEIPCFRGVEVAITCETQCTFDSTSDDYGDPFLVLMTGQTTVGDSATELGIAPFVNGAVWKPGQIYEDGPVGAINGSLTVDQYAGSINGIAVCPMYTDGNQPFFKLVSYSVHSVHQDAILKNGFTDDSGYETHAYVLGFHFTTHVYYFPSTFTEALSKSLNEMRIGPWEHATTLINAPNTYGLVCGTDDIGDPSINVINDWPSNDVQYLPRCKPQMCYYGVGKTADVYQSLVTDTSDSGIVPHGTFYHSAIAVAVIFK